MYCDHVEQLCVACVMCHVLGDVGENKNVAKWGSHIEPCEKAQEHHVVDPVYVE